MSSAVAEATCCGREERQARALFELVALGDEFVEFLTLPAYDRID